MILRQQMARTGNWLFTRRSYLPIVFIPVFAFGVADFHFLRGSHRLDQEWDIGCLAVALLGFAIRIAAVGCAPAGTSGRNTSKQQAKELNTSGMYSLVRHPLYVGNFIIWLGVSSVLHSWYVSLIATLVYWFHYERIMLAEEEYLERTFGASFRTWALRTPAVLPHPSHWVPPLHPFSLRTVLRREFNTFFALIVSFTILDVLCEKRVTGSVRLDPMWIAIFPPSLGLYFVLRTLKKYTHWLQVPGR